jgi:radical SAM-linked protein
MDRFRIHFSKTSAMRYTSHLDLHKTWERTFRRAGLPLVYSQGFNPHPRLQLACALPLGFTSDCELLDAWMNAESFSENEAHLRLEKAVPPGLKVHSMILVDPQAPALQTRMRSARYLATLLEPVPDLDQRVTHLLIAESLTRIRRGRSYDLRPLIEDLQIALLDEQDNQRLEMQLAARENNTGRPEEVLEALGLSSLAVRIHRSHLLLSPEQVSTNRD